MKTTTFTAKNVQLILDNMEIEQLAASASISLNPNVTWLKLVLTDDGFNANSQRVPKEEFANVLRTGNFMPLKMAYHEISEGHEGVFPIGVMTHLKTEGDSIQSLAALWDKERKTDVAYLKQRYADGEPIDISWEITYLDTQVEDGGVALRGVAMNAATIVSLPAYEGRTPVLAISSLQDSTGENETMEDTINLAEHQRLLDEQKTGYEAKLAELQQALSAVQDELNTLKPKYDDVLSFKQKIETEQANTAKLESLRKKFVDAQLNVSNEYFDERSSSFLAMSDEQIDFFIQELLAAFSSKTEDGKASISVTSQSVPAINVQTSTNISPKDIVEFLRKSN